MHDAIKVILVATNLVAICGCTEPMKFEKKFSTEHFDYYVEEGRSYMPCDDSHQWLDRYYEANAKFYGAPLPEDKKLQYHLINWTSHEHLDCTPGIPCTDGTNIYSTTQIGASEIARALALQIGDPPLYFQDGLATVLSCGDGWDSTGPIDTIHLYKLFESDEYKGWSGGFGANVSLESASFVHYLIATFGLPTFLSFYSHTPRDAKLSIIEAVFAQKFGVSLDETWHDWIKMPTPFPGDVCLRIAECDSTMPEFTNGPVGLECGPSDYHGTSREGMLRFQIGTDGPKQIVTEAIATNPQAASFVNFVGCGGGNMLPLPWFTSGFVSDFKHKTVSLDPVRPLRRYVLDGPPGDYFARFHGSNQSVIHTETLDAPSPMRDSCAPAAAPLLVDENEEIVLSSRMTERSCAGFWCPGYGWDVQIGPKGGSIVMGPYFTEGRTLFSPNKIYLCSDPCPTNSNQCEMLEFNLEEDKTVQSMQTFAPGTVVHVGAPLAAYEEYFFMRMYVVSP